MHAVLDFKKFEKDDAFYSAIQNSLKAASGTKLDFKQCLLAPIKHITDLGLMAGMMKEHVSVEHCKVYLMDFT